MRRTGNHDETKRIFMDLDVVLKSHDCKVSRIPDEFQFANKVLKIDKKGQG